MFTVAELQEIILSLKAALQRAIASGGVTSYTLKSGQGDTEVQQASIASITSQIQIYQGMLNELQSIQSGSCFNVMRD